MKVVLNVFRLFLPLVIALLFSESPAWGKPDIGGSIHVSEDIDFGEVPVDSSAKERGMVISNNHSTEVLQVTSITCLKPFYERPPAISITNIAPGDSILVHIGFRPPSDEVYNGTVIVGSSSGWIPGMRDRLHCTGTGINVPKIRVTGNLDFGGVPFGDSDSRTMTIENEGTATLTVSNITYPSGFTGSWSGSVPDHSSQDITVTFSPISVAGYGGTIAVVSDAYDGSGKITCSGTGTSTKIIRLSGGLKFGDVDVGDSDSETMTIHNDGNTTMTISEISYPAGFTGPTYKAYLIGAGSSHDIMVTFAPATAMSYSGMITVTSDKTAGDHTHTCSGTGVEPPTRIVRLEGNLAFGDLEVGESASRSMTIFNDGNSDLTVTGISYPSGFSGIFSGVIGAGKNTGVAVLFEPVAETAYGGVLTVASDKTGGTNTRSCSGNGIIIIHEPTFAWITNCVPVASGIMIEWIPAAGSNAVVSWSSNLLSMPFTNLPAALPYPLHSYTDTVHGADNHGFYRVELVP